MMESLTIEKVQVVGLHLMDARMLPFTVSSSGSLGYGS